MFDLCFFSQTREALREWKKARFASGQSTTPPKPKST
jgi:hypothetical protein